MSSLVLITVNFSLYQSGTIGRLHTVELKGRAGLRRGEELAFLRDAQLKQRYGRGNADSVFGKHSFFYEFALLIRFH